MGGCLGPTRDVLPIYIDLIDQVYSEAERVEIQESPGLHIYEQVRDRANKKGLLRKLSEYLSVHRLFLNESMQHNFRLMRQNKTFMGRVTALVVIDHFIENLDKFVEKTVQPRTNRSLKIPLRQNADSQTFDVRFETIFFQVALQLYDSEVRLRDKLLHSIIDFSKKHDDKFSCDQLVGQLLERLVELAKSPSGDKELCTSTFARLLQRSNEGVEDSNASQNSLRVFLAVWMETDQKTVMRSCEEIFRNYIDRCMTSREYGFIYIVIFQVYDHNCFREERLQKLQDHLLMIVSQDDLKDQFLKGMFQHLLSYLCVCDSESVRVRCEQGLFNTTYDMLKRSYPNILKKETKRNGFATLHRWTSKRFINLNELVSFNRSALLNCFTFNLEAYIDDRQVVDWLIASFFELVALFDSECLVMVLQMLVEEIHLTKHHTVEEGWLLIRIAKKCIEDYDISGIADHFPNIMRPLHTMLPSRIKNQLLVLMCSIVGKCASPFKPSVLEPLTAFLYSIFDNLIIDEPIKDKYFFVCSVLTLLRRLNQKGQAELLVTFIEQAQQKQSQKLVPALQRYLCRILAYESLEMLTTVKQVPDQMRKINTRIHSIADNVVLMQEIDAFLINYPAWPSLPTALRRELETEQKSRRYEDIKKLFERLSRDSTNDDRQFGGKTVYFNNNKSVISQRLSGRTDDSFNNIYGLIRDGSENFDDEGKSRSGWPKTSNQPFGATAAAEDRRMRPTSYANQTK